MSVVGMTMLSGETIYVNPLLVTTLSKPDGADAEKATVVSFGKDVSIIVKGDIDYVAFQLFPNGVR